MNSKSKTLTRQELETLIFEQDESIKFVQKKMTAHSSQLWGHFHQVFINDVQQQFVSCNKCKVLLAYQSMNGTNNLRTHLNFCATIRPKKDDFQQTNVFNFYSPTKKKVSKKIKSAVLQSCVEFVALDGRAFEIISRAGFQNLAQVLFDAGRACNISSLSVKDVLPHATTVRDNYFA